MCKPIKAINFMGNFAITISVIINQEQPDRTNFMPNISLKVAENLHSTAE
jgi:hypothetical protein